MYVVCFFLRSWSRLKNWISQFAAHSVTLQPKRRDSLKTIVLCLWHNLDIHAFVSTTFNVCQKRTFSKATKMFGEHFSVESRWKTEQTKNMAHTNITISSTIEIMKILFYSMIWCAQYFVRVERKWTFLIASVVFFFGFGNIDDTLSTSIFKAKSMHVIISRTGWIQSKIMLCFRHLSWLSFKTIRKQ